MKKFNSADLFTGYLKQLLHDFNLPKIKVYTKNHQHYCDLHSIESPEILGTKRFKQNSGLLNVRYFPYLRNGEIQEYIEDDKGNWGWQNIGTVINTVPKYYTYGQKILNYTKNLKIDSNIYDSYTHEYLGDYLRFQRDYNSINLMPLYNCFSNRACDKLNLTFNKNNQNVTFNTADLAHKIYMVPVKLFQTYTLAIDSTSPIELCCGVYGDYQDTREKFSRLPENTYMRITTSAFSTPILYGALAAPESSSDNFLGVDLIELAQNEADLKLFIKIPVNNTSTIVLLEGNYLTWNDSVWVPGGASKTKNTNKTVINLDSVTCDTELPLITPLQLLQFNTKEQHPFADRLVEYLLGNAITNAEDEIYDNVRRAQKALTGRENNYKIKLPGVWDPMMTKLFYEYMTSTKSEFDVNHDILGFVDKDVEKYYKSFEKYYDSSVKDNSTVSLSNIELKQEEK